MFPNWFFCSHHARMVEHRELNIVLNKWTTYLALLCVLQCLRTHALLVSLRSVRSIRPKIFDFRKIIFFLSRAGKFVTILIDEGHPARKLLVKIVSRLNTTATTLISAAISTDSCLERVPGGRR